MPEVKPGNNFFTRGSLINAVIIIALLTVAFVPPVKALLIRGLMSIGLFKADVTEQAPATPAVADIVFEDAAGRAVHLGQLKSKVVFLNFWATWCPPCLAEMPSINSLHQKLKADTNIVFVMVDADSQLRKAAQFMAAHSYSMPLYQVISAVPDAVYGGSLPTTVIFDKGGRIAFRHDGAADYDTGEVEDFLKKLSDAR